ncbi:MAG: trypsin-like serine protease [Pirellulaceae bacterium]|nr:trypsin-like serine protease [Pirellulaceae bacterium]
MAKQKSGHVGEEDTTGIVEHGDQTMTEYERIGEIDPNQCPDTESSNSRSEESGDDTEYEGCAGLEHDAPSAESDFVTDAIHGSYDLPSVPEVLIGADNRIRIRATASYPWRAICALKITAASGRRFIGTGWFVSARTVITAGHCIFMHNEGGWVRSVEVIPGMDDATRPFGSATGTAFRSVTGWTQSRQRENDYGTIILPANARLGDRTGTFGFANRNDSFLRAARLNLSGYPGDKGGNQQWFMAERTKSVSSRVIVYDIDTMGGQSGSPVWVLQDGKRFAVGIHTNGHQSGNSATRIEASVYNRIDAWRALGT